MESQTPTKKTLSLAADLALRCRMILDAINILRPVTSAPSIKIISEHVATRSEHAFITAHESKSLPTKTQELKTLPPIPELPDGLTTELTSELAKNAIGLESLIWLLKKEHPQLHNPLLAAAEQHAKQYPRNNSSELQLSIELLLVAELILSEEGHEEAITAFAELRQSAKDKHTWRQQVLKALKQFDSKKLLHELVPVDGSILRAKHYRVNPYLDIYPRNSQSLLTSKQIEIIASFCVKVKCGMLKNSFPGSNKLDQIIGYYILAEGRVTDWVKLAKLAESQQSNMQ